MHKTVSAAVLSEPRAGTPGGRPETAAGGDLVPAAGRMTGGPGCTSLCCRHCGHDDGYSHTEGYPECGPSAGRRADPAAGAAGGTR